MKQRFISVLIVIALAGMMFYVVFGEGNNTYLPIVMDMPTLTPTETPTPLPTATAAPRNRTLVFDLSSCPRYTASSYFDQVNELIIYGSEPIYGSASASYGMWVDGVYYTYSSLEVWAAQPDALPYSAIISFGYKSLLYVYHQDGTPRHSCAH